MGRKIDLTGRVFGDWRVVKDSGKRQGGFVVWECECSCGNVGYVAVRNLTTGASKSCGKCKNIYGLGINDIQAKNSCEFYRTWKRVLQRTISPKRDVYYPSYIGVAVTEEWLRLSSFKMWMESQPYAGLEIDKDILKLGAKIYSPETCMFVPPRINLLLGTSDGKRGEYPLGVCLHNNGRNRFMAKSGGEYLGLFSCPLEAHKAWQNRKASQIIEAVEWWRNDPEVNHTFNPAAAQNLVRISSYLAISSAKGQVVDTLSLTGTELEHLGEAKGV